MNNIIAGPMAELLDVFNSVDKKRPPVIFYYRTGASLFKSPSVAVIGLQQPSPDGIRRSL